MAEPEQTLRRNLTGAVAPALAAAALAGLGALLIVSRNGEPTVPAEDAGRDCIQQGIENVGGPIELIGQDGARVTQADFTGAPALVYFGFTNCPDICPSTMYMLAEAIRLTGRDDIQPILISVDPRRDTPERMAAYVTTAGFAEGLRGLTGAQAQIDAALAAFHAYGQAHAPPDGAPADVYNVDHTSLVYVMDADWRAVSAASTVAPEDPSDPRSPMVAVAPERIAACIAAGLGRS